MAAKQKKRIEVLTPIIVALIGVIASIGTILVKEVVAPSATEKAIEKAVVELTGTIDTTVETEIQKYTRTEDGRLALISAAKGTVPIGSIVSSTLDYHRFCQINELPSLFNAKTSVWAPCDGRDLAGSGYAKSNSTISPDLRGVFIRGVNSMYPGDTGAGTLNPKQKNPENIQAGVFQNDAFQNHTHLIGSGKSDKNSGSETHKGRFADFQVENGSHRTKGVNKSPQDERIQTKFDREETRPKNVSVYYFIKIN